MFEIKSTTTISQEKMALKQAHNERVCENEKERVCERERKGQNAQTNDENNPLELLKGNVRNGFKCPSKSEKQ